MPTVLGALGLAAHIPPQIAGRNFAPCLQFSSWQQKVKEPDNSEVDQSQADKNKAPASEQNDDEPCPYQKRHSKPERPTCALYLRNLDGEPDANGMVHEYFAQSHDIKTHRYSLVITIDRAEQFESALLFDNHIDPHQLHPLSFNPMGQLERELFTLLAQELSRIDDPWACRGVLSHWLPYGACINKDSL